MSATPPGEWVLLDDHELELAVVAGGRRARNALRMGLRDRAIVPPDHWGVHINGAAAELAVAKWRSAYWGACVTDWRKLPGDVGDGIEVRSSTHPRGRLLVSTEDKPDRAFVLALTSWLPRVRLVGWVVGVEAMDSSLWDTTMRTPTYVVPWERLRPLDTLDHFLRERVAA